MKKIIISLALGILISLSTYAQNTYTLDKNHARLSFSAWHMNISFIDGIFKTFDATLVSSKEDFSDAQIEMTADVKSVNTEVEMRDNHLREHWFEVEKYPTMTFKSTSFKKEKGKNYKLTGNLTLHGVTKPISFDVVYNGKVLNPMSKKYACGFTITGKLNRKDFGIAVEAPVGDEIQLKSNVEFSIN